MNEPTMKSTGIMRCRFDQVEEIESLGIGFQACIKYGVNNPAELTERQAAEVIMHRRDFGWKPKKGKN